MTNIFDIPDDIWSIIFKCLTPYSFISTIHTCSHIHNLSDSSKYPGINKYWKYQCERQWKQVKHTCTKSNNKGYVCGMETAKNYNCQTLFVSMINFVVKINQDNVPRSYFWNPRMAEVLSSSDT